MNTKARYQFGFTVIEITIIVLIVIVLLSLTAVGIRSSLERSEDSAKIGSVQLVQLALEDYKGFCKDYPEDLDLDQDHGCRDAAGETVRLGDFLSEIPEADIRYVPLRVSDDCLFYHIGIELNTDARSEQVTDSDFDSTGAIASGIGRCDGSGFDGSASGVYDVIIPFDPTTS